MKNLKLSLLSAWCLCGLIMCATAQSEASKTDAQQDQTTAQAPPATATVATNSTAPPPEEKKAEVPLPATLPRVLRRKNTETNGLITMNFRNAPLDLVLNYLVDAAGFVVLPETEIRGTVDVWSSQPVTKEEAVKLLDTVLKKNGYAAVRDGQTLTICTLEDAKKKNIATETTRVPTDIAKDNTIVTMIIPVRSVVAAQAAKELAPLISNSAQLTSDDAGNALIMTAPHSEIRRVAEIIQKLDMASSSVNQIRVFPLLYEDAKTLATVIKDLFPDATAQGGRGGGGFNGFRGRGGGGGGGGGPGGGFAGLFGGGGGGGDTSNAQARTPHVSATADDHSNSLVVSAPEELMAIIEEVIQNVDKPSTDITVVKVFHLENADSGEMVDLISNLFPDDTNANNQNGQQMRFTPFPFGGLGGGRRGGAAAAEPSDRMKKLGRVLAVADRRTASVIVSTSKDLMEQIEPMIARLDKDKSHKFHTFVIPLTNASPEDVVQVMNDLFPTSSRSTRSGSGSQAGSALTQRATTLNQQNLQSSSQGGFSSSSFGSKP